MIKTIQHKNLSAIISVAGADDSIFAELQKMFEKSPTLFLSEFTTLINGRLWKICPHG